MTSYLGDTTLGELIQITKHFFSNPSNI